MGTLHKYIFKQVFGASFLTVALFVFVLVVGNVVKEVMGEFAAGRIDLSLFIYLHTLKETLFYDTNKQSWELPCGD